MSLFVATDESSFVIGAPIVIDGGYTALSGLRRQDLHTYSRRQVR